MAYCGDCDMNMSCCFEDGDRCPECWILVDQIQDRSSGDEYYDPSEDGGTWCT
jgi:hypothetical protein